MKMVIVQNELRDAINAKLDTAIAACPDDDSQQHDGASLPASDGSVYRFSTFQELVDRVPGDRIKDCMEELGTVLATAKLSTQLTYAVACNLAKADGKELPPEPARIIVLPQEFEWMDDGKRELEARMVDAKGNGLFAVEITPNAEVCQPEGAKKS